MSKKAESTIQREIMLAASEEGMTLWRNNVGKGWIAPPPRTQRASRRTTVTLEPGDVVLRQPNWVEWGLCVGSSDLIGLKPVVVMPHDVGQVIAQFVAVECKTATGKATDKQKHFLDFIIRKGGNARIARSADDIASLP